MRKKSAAVWTCSVVTALSLSLTSCADSSSTGAEAQQIRGEIELLRGPFDRSPQAADQTWVSAPGQNEATHYYETANYVVQVFFRVPVVPPPLLYVRSK